MRITEAMARVRGRVTDRIAAPQRRAAAEMVGTVVLVVLVLYVAALAVNTQQKGGN